MGCTQQHQYCNPTTGACTNLTGIIKLWRAFHTDTAMLSFNANQRALIAGNLNGTISQNTFLASMLDLNVESLMALDSIAGIGKISAPLSSYQWTIEVSHWFKILLANMQRLSVSYVTGVHNDAVKYVERPTSTLGKALCMKQLIHDPSVVSFSVFGISLVSGIGLFIILLDFALPPFVGWIQKKSRRGLHRQREWHLNSTLQLLRLAFEKGGQGTWSKEDDTVPVTERGELLDLCGGLAAGHADMENEQNDRGRYGHVYTYDAESATNRNSGMMRENKPNVRVSRQRFEYT